ncbi:MAG: Fic family protein [Nitriliruptoraceae bacterium]
MRPTTPPRFGRSPLLVDLIAEVERLSTRVAAAPLEARTALARTATPAAATASLVLDGARREAIPDRAAAERSVASRLPPADDQREVARASGSWLDTLRVLDDGDDAELRALEVLGVLAADDADDLTDQVLRDPGTVLVELHRRLTRGLVADERVGQPRTTDQAVHDGSTGRIVFLTPEPAQIPRELSLLELWLATTGAREHGLIASGVLHFELLRLHPFDAANGRLARAAARLVLRARGLDPDHLAAPEIPLAADPLGYHEEVASTLRRRDLTVWLERWGEAVADGLRDAARELGVLEAAPGEAARRFAAATPAFTIAEYRGALGSGPQGSRAELAALLDAGLISRVPGSRGLRFRRRGSAADAT